MRLIMLNRCLADLTGSVEFRMAGLFTTLAERTGQKRRDGVFVPIQLARQDIADLVGTTIETAIRVMSRWQKEGLVETEKDGFRLCNPLAKDRTARVGTLRGAPRPVISARPR
jgi:CRP/FNR family transcriptional regulator